MQLIQVLINNDFLFSSSKIYRFTLIFIFDDIIIPWYPPN